nr:glycoside hydrolase family 2 protein [Nonlabens ulvanivorans]
MRISLLLVLVIFISSCKEERPNKERQYLESNWSLLKEVDYSLISDSVQIPSTVHKELLPFIKHPFQGNNEDSLQWITEEDWIYETVFALDKETLTKEHITLNFEGIDTYASIELNGHEILETDNAFLNWQVDVKAFLEEENELYVTIKSPLEIEAQKATLNPYTLPEGNRIYTRKAQYQYGWDWGGPKLNTMGIWKPVYLEAYDDFKIDDVYIKQNFVQDSTANLTAQIKLSDKRTELLHYKIKVNDSLYWEQDYQPKAQEDEFEIHFEIPQVQLWWPYNIGEPYLYDIEVLVSTNDELIDSKKLKTGIRTIELVNEPDEHGTSFFFKVNDVPVYMKGANYIPQNSMQDLVTDDHYEKLLSDVKEANMNMLRVWGGGGIYENDIFYEKCDEKGILVWQDFMFACAMYPGNARFRESVTNEITQQITRLRNHSSIALWCGNNETSEAWHNWGWQEGRSQAERDSIWEDYRAVFQIAMPKYVSELTKEPYWESSPEYGRGNPKYEFEGDAHDWRVWHDAYPFEHFEKHVPRFMSEFGFQSHPSYEAIRYINKNGTVNIQSEDYASHQKHPRGNELIREYMERDFPVPTNDEDYVYISQLLQAYGMSKGIQAHRRERPYNMGTLYWQLNDCWPAVSWSSIDYFGNWKALHYQVKRDFENVLISNVVENDTLKTYVVNDNLETLKENLEIIIKDFNGNVLVDHKIESRHSAVPATLSREISFIALKTLNINLTDTYVVSKFGNQTVISFLERPKNLKLLPAKIEMTTKQIENGFEITIESDVFAKDVFLYTDNKGHFIDNFFSLEPNAKKTIIFETDSDEEPDFRYKTLNG